MQALTLQSSARNLTASTRGTAQRETPPRDGTFTNGEQSTARPSKISEVILAGNNPQADLTFAMLAHLSHQHKSAEHQGRWLTWICPMLVSREALAQFNFDVMGLRILHPKTEAQIPQLMQDALNAGTSHTVVAHCQGISSKLFPWLENAAYAGDSAGLIIRPQ